VRTILGTDNNKATRYKGKPRTVTSRKRHRPQVARLRPRLASLAEAVFLT